MTNKRMARRLVRPVVVAEYTGIPIQSLAHIRCRGDGPPFMKVGQRVLYDLDDVDSWLDAHRVGSTSESAA